MMRALYNALLHLYPAAFRAEYGEEMRSLFARRSGDAANPAAMAALWAETIADTLVNAARVHWDILRQDLRYTARTLRRSVPFSLFSSGLFSAWISADTSPACLSFS